MLTNASTTKHCLPWLVATALFNSLQLSGMNSMAYADIDAAVTTMASTLQQMSMSFGPVFGPLITAVLLRVCPSPTNWP